MMTNQRAIEQEVNEAFEKERAFGGCVESCGQ
jgi:hypothetical protein